MTAPILTVTARQIAPAILEGLRAHFGRWFSDLGYVEARDPLTADPTGEIAEWSMVVATERREAVGDEATQGRVGVRTSWRLTCWIPAGPAALAQLDELGDRLLAFIHARRGKGRRGNRWGFDVACDAPQNAVAEADDPGIHGLVSLVVTWDQVHYTEEGLG
jgi:hypothetical protein